MGVSDKQLRRVSVGGIRGALLKYTTGVFLSKSPNKP
jgi:hypothetical protein